jgi:hypothetical protein
MKYVGHRFRSRFRRDRVASRLRKQTNALQREGKQYKPQTDFPAPLHRRFPVRIWQLRRVRAITRWDENVPVFSDAATSTAFKLLFAEKPHQEANYCKDTGDREPGSPWRRQFPLLLQVVPNGDNQK